MKILITGATGLVGSEIVRLCKARNIAVNYLTTSPQKVVSENGYQGFYWNPEANEIDMDCFEGVTAILNLAGASISKQWTTSYKKLVLSSRLDALRTLHQAVGKIDHSNITSFVSASAIGIYPNSFSNFYEEHDERVDASFLGDVVAAWENEANTFEAYNFNVSKIRIGLVLSDKGGALPEMAKPIQYGVGAAFGTGKQWQSWIHCHDLAKMFLFVSENALEGTYNGVGPNPVNNSKLVKEIAKALKRPLFLPNIPQFAMKLILGEMSYLLFASQRVCSKKIEEEGFVFNYPNVCSALQAIYHKQEAKRKVAEIRDRQKEYV